MGGGPGGPGSGRSGGRRDGGGPWSEVLAAAAAIFPNRAASSFLSNPLGPGRMRRNGYEEKKAEGHFSHFASQPVET